MQEQLLIKELGEELGLSSLSLDDNHACTIVSDDNALNIQFQPYDHTFLVYAVVEVGKNGFSSDVYEYIAGANLFGQATLGMHLGYYTPAHAIVLSANRHLDGLTAVDFANFLSFFLVELSKWQKKIAEIMASDDTVAMGTPEDHGDVHEVTYSSAHMLRI